MDKTKRISKSQFVRGLQCPKSLYLYNHNRDLATPPDAAAQAIFDQGTAVGELAQKRFPGGVLIQEDHEHPDEAIAHTKEAIAAGAKVLYEAAAEFEGTLIRADIMTKNDNGSWDLAEVKSSTKVKPQHLDDAAFQAYVLTEAGFKIRKTYLMFIDNAYVRNGDLDLEALFTLEDITDQLKWDPVELHARIKNFQAIIAQAETPNIRIGEQCSKPYACDFKEHCWKAVPEDSVWSISGIRKPKAAELWNAGVETITQVPKGTKLSERQTKQCVSIQTGLPIIDRAKLRKALDSLVYPLHSLDFETIAPAIPPYDGLRPFLKLVFQASVHTLPEPGAKLEHTDILIEAGKDPRDEMAAFLRGTLGNVGSIVAYNAPFEKSCMKYLGEYDADHADWFAAAIKRLWDLALPIKNHYMHPLFHGSWSLKAITPVILTDVTYTGMEVGKGDEAAALYQAACEGRLSEAECKKLYEDLRVYCAQDTLTPLGIIEHLESITAGEKAPA